MGGSQFQACLGRKVPTTPCQPIKAGHDVVFLLSQPLKEWKLGGSRSGQTWVFFLTGKKLKAKRAEAWLQW
jgi:hypothetical protein